MYFDFYESKNYFYRYEFSANISKELIIIKIPFAFLVKTSNINLKQL